MTSRQSPLSPAFDGARPARPPSVADGAHAAGRRGSDRWSHYWPQHLGLDLSGSVNLELFVINYLFRRRTPSRGITGCSACAESATTSCRSASSRDGVLIQTGVSPADRRHLWHRAIRRKSTVSSCHPRRVLGRFRFLTVTNSHDLERYETSCGPRSLLATPSPQATMSSWWSRTMEPLRATRTIATLLRERPARPSPVLSAEFTSKDALIELYKSCDAFVSAHRGEGFGMKILDAMACGLPVVTPLFGGPTAYCTAANAFPGRTSRWYRWATVSIRGPSELPTRRCGPKSRPAVSATSCGEYVTREPSRRVGEQGSTQVIDRFSWEQAASRIRPAVECGFGEERRGSGPAV